MKKIPVESANSLEALYESLFSQKSKWSKRQKDLYLSVGLIGASFIMGSFAGVNTPVEIWIFTMSALTGFGGACLAACAL